MKLRMPWLIKAVALAATKLIRCWIGTLRVRIRQLGGKDANPNHTAPDDRYIYAFWHENITIMPFLFTRRDIYGLIGAHSDAELFAEVLRFLRMPSIRGSTNRGGIRAVRQVLRKTGRKAHLALAPDGPRGPRRRAQPGLAYLSSRTGMPVVPIGIGFDRPWRLPTWDRFAVFRPWSRAALVFAAPIAIPADAGKEELETYLRQIEETFRVVSAMAEQWAESGRCPPVPARSELVSPGAPEQRKAS